MQYEVGKYKCYIKRELLGEGDKAQIFQVDLGGIGAEVEYATIKKTTIKVLSRELIQMTNCCHEPRSGVLIKGLIEVDILFKTTDQEGEVTYVTPVSQFIMLDHVYDGLFEVEATIESATIHDMEEYKKGSNIGIAWNTCIYSV